MYNQTIFEMLLNAYNRFAFTNKYIIGFPYKGVIYYGFTTSDILDRYLTLGTASRNRGYLLRFRPRNAEKLAMLTACEMKPLMSEKLFNTLVSESKFNRGEVFEKAITELFGQEWKKDSVKFTDAGDIEINGIAYQIKFDEASFAPEKLLRKLLETS